MDWRPIETAPKDGASLLLFREGEMMVGRWYSGYNEWGVSPPVHENQVRTWASIGPKEFWPGPTHWMPLPEPPHAPPDPRPR